MKFSPVAFLLFLAAGRPAQGAYLTMLGGSCTRLVEESPSSSAFQQSLKDLEFQEKMDAIFAAVGLLPVVGDVAAGLWDLWSGIYGQSTSQVISQMFEEIVSYIQDQGEALVDYIDQEILNTAMTSVQANLLDGEEDLEQYEDYGGCGNLEDAIEAFERAYSYIASLGDNQLHFLPLLTKLAVIHIDTYRKRHSAFPELTGCGTTVISKDEAQKVYNDYYALFQEMLPRWWQWRQTGLSISLKEGCFDADGGASPFQYDTYCSKGPLGMYKPGFQWTVQDEHTGTECSNTVVASSNFYIDGSCKNTDTGMACKDLPDFGLPSGQAQSCFETYCLSPLREEARQWMYGSYLALRNELLADMLQSMDVWAYMHRFIPDQESADPVYPDQNANEPLNLYTDGVVRGPYRYHAGGDFGDGLAGWAPYQLDFMNNPTNPISDGLTASSGSGIFNKISFDGASGEIGLTVYPDRSKGADDIVVADRDTHWINSIGTKHWTSAGNPPSIYSLQRQIVGYFASFDVGMTDGDSESSQQVSCQDGTEQKDFVEMTMGKQWALTEMYQYQEGGGDVVVKTLWKPASVVGYPFRRRLRGSI